MTGFVSRKIRTLMTAVFAVAAVTIPLDVAVAKGTFGSRAKYQRDGLHPPHCDDSQRRLRHFEGDGHTTGHEHLGHGHKWRKHNFKGYLTKPPCYVRQIGQLGGSARPALFFPFSNASLRDAPGADAYSFWSQQS